MDMVSLPTKTDLENDEELKQIDVDIQDILQSNTAVEGQVIRKRAEITCLENQAQQWELENSAIEKQNTNMNDYLNILRGKVINHLSSIKLPQWNDAITEDNYEDCIKRIQSLGENRNGENNVLFGAIKSAILQIRIS
ncbi:hypothetical protein ScPMuIL_006197 [Solemya velum]